MKPDLLIAICAMAVSIVAVYYARQTYNYQRTSWQFEKAVELYLAADYAYDKLESFQEAFSNEKGEVMVSASQYAEYGRERASLMFAFRRAYALGYTGPRRVELEAFFNCSKGMTDDRILFSRDFRKEVFDSLDPIRDLSKRHIAFLWHSDLAAIADERGPRV